jgi:predicted unusual protein kinase regulating ubiquinone biosynthesis (AarF/ABC1/UbiB family)
MLRKRYVKIVWYFAKVTIHIVFWDIFLTRIGFRSIVLRSRPGRLRRMAQSFRVIAVQMGGVMIKVGQFLSSRADVLPIEITDELAGLQDEVPAESFEDILLVAENEFGVQIEQRFDYFHPTPVASASLGQVHRAVLKCREQDQKMLGVDDTVDTDNPPDHFLTDVVVKIQRPNIESLISTDLAALRTVGGWLRRYKPIRRRADVPALLEAFETILYQEIDYLNEGRNIEIFSSNFTGVAGVRVPKVVWANTTKRVLTLEDIGGIKINDFEKITTSGISRKEVASRLLDIYFKQIFEDGFFHADPHPGNLFVLAPEFSEKGNGRWELALVDFGMMGVINPNTRQGLREMLVAIATRDTAKMIEAYKTLDVLLPDANLDLLERADQVLFERFWGKSYGELREISSQEVTEFLSEFRELVFNMPFQVPHDLIFLARAVGLLSGLCAGLDPHFNVWEHMAPYAQKIVYNKNIDGSVENLSSWIPQIMKEFGKYFQRLYAFPVRAEAVLSQIEQGNLHVHDPVLSDRIHKLTQAVWYISTAIIFSGLVLGAVQLYLNAAEILSIYLGVAAVLVLVGSWVIQLKR